MGRSDRRSEGDGRGRRGKPRVLWPRHRRRSKDDPRNQDNIGDKEILVVSFGTSFNDSRAATSRHRGRIQAAYPDWSVRRAFTAQIIINHVQARDGEKIDNMEQALERAVANGVKDLVVQPPT